MHDELKRLLADMDVSPSPAVIDFVRNFATRWCFSNIAG